MDLNVKVDANAWSREKQSTIIPRLLLFRLRKGGEGLAIMVKANKMPISEGIKANYSHWLHEVVAVWHKINHAEK